MKLADIVGESALHAFSKDHTDDYLELLREFELQKKGIKPDTEGNIVMRLPYTFKAMYEDRIKRLSRNQKKIDADNCIKISKDKMIIESREMKRFFDKALLTITEKLKEILMKPDMKDANSILMVGGFSESIMLQKIISDSFSEMRIIIPQEAGSAVLKGAVIYGHRPHIISERKCKYTYGLRIYAKFNENIHDRCKKICADGVDICEDIFSKHVEIDQTLRVDESQSSQIYHPTFPDQKAMYFEVYASTDRHPIYVTDTSCIKLGKLLVPMNDVTGGKSREVKVQMFYSGTELGVEAITETDGTPNNVKAYFDFLG